jgi:hypothetical protein
MQAAAWKRLHPTDPAATALRHHQAPPLLPSALRLRCPGRGRSSCAAAAEAATPPAVRDAIKMARAPPSDTAVGVVKHMVATTAGLAAPDYGQILLSIKTPTLRWALQQLQQDQLELQEVQQEVSQLMASISSRHAQLQAAALASASASAKPKARKRRSSSKSIGAAAAAADEQQPLAAAAPAAARAGRPRAAAGTRRTSSRAAGTSTTSSSAGAASATRTTRTTSTAATSGGTPHDAPSQPPAPAAPAPHLAPPPPSSGWQLHAPSAGPAQHGALWTSPAPAAPGAFVHLAARYPAAAQQGPEAWRSWIGRCLATMDALHQELRRLPPADSPARLLCQPQELEAAAALRHAYEVVRWGFALHPRLQAELCPHGLDAAVGRMAAAPSAAAGRWVGQHMDPRLN